MTYEAYYGLQLNESMAMAMDSAATMRGVRAAFSAKPDLAILDAMSATGEDVRKRAAEQTLAATAGEGMREFKSIFGMR